MSGKIEVRLARAEEAEDLLGFLAAHWRADHVFVRSPEVMFWQHSPPDDPSSLNWIIAKEVGREGPEGVYGALGFIPLRRFDSGSDWSETALAVWKAREDAPMPGLGLMLLKALDRLRKPDLIYAIGTTPMVRPIYQALGYRIGEMRQAALFPEAGGTPRLARDVPEEARRALPQDPGAELIRLTEDRIPEGAEAAVDAFGALGAPRKSWAYVRERFLRHPWYEYDLRLARLDGEFRALIVSRRTEGPEGAAALRIVDLIGDPRALSRCAPALRAVTAEADCEYLDLMHWGVDADLLRAGGFVSPEDHPGFVLPNYFSPFEQRNVSLGWAFKARGEISAREVRLFRADSDQDRPNKPEPRRQGF